MLYRRSCAVQCIARQPGSYTGRGTTSKESAEHALASTNPTNRLSVRPLPVRGPSVRFFLSFSLGVSASLSLSLARSCLMQKKGCSALDGP